MGRTFRLAANNHLQRDPFFIFFFWIRIQDRSAALNKWRRHIKLRRIYFVPRGESNQYVVNRKQLFFYLAVMAGEISSFPSGCYRLRNIADRDATESLLSEANKRRRKADRKFVVVSERRLFIKSLIYFIATEVMARAKRPANFKKGILSYLSWYPSRDWTGCRCCPSSRP